MLRETTPTAGLCSLCIVFIAGGAFAFHLVAWLLGEDT